MYGPASSPFYSSTTPGPAESLRQASEEDLDEPTISEPQHHDDVHKLDLKNPSLTKAQDHEHLTVHKLDPKKWNPIDSHPFYDEDSEDLDTEDASSAVPPELLVRPLKNWKYTKKHRPTETSHNQSDTNATSETLRPIVGWRDGIEQPYFRQNDTDSVEAIVRPDADRFNPYKDHWNSDSDPNLGPNVGWRKGLVLKPSSNNDDHSSTEATTTEPTGFRPIIGWRKGAEPRIIKYYDEYPAINSESTTYEPRGFIPIIGWRKGSKPQSSRPGNDSDHVSATEPKLQVKELRGNILNYRLSRPHHRRITTTRKPKGRWGKPSATNDEYGYFSKRLQKALVRDHERIVMATKP